MADINTVPVYEGGLSDFDGPSLWPTEAKAETMYKPDPTDGEVNTEAGGPVQSKGSADGGFVMNAGPEYGGPADLADNLKMNTVDLDDIKGPEIVNISNIKAQTDGY